MVFDQQQWVVFDSWWEAHLSWTQVPWGKDASLFYMIPLERWNVERKLSLLR
jgi:hypothetical protein